MTFRTFFLYGALGLVALALVGCSTTIGGVHVYGGISYREPVEGLPLAERFTPTPTVEPLPTGEVWPTRTPPPTLTMIPSVTPSPEPLCGLLVTQEKGLNKRAGPNTNAARVSGVGYGWHIQATQFIQDDPYLWAYDVNEPPGWVAVRHYDEWWVSGTAGCTAITG